MAADRMYDVGTQLMSTALIWNSFPMAGSAILMDETMKGVRKEANVAITRAGRFREVSLIIGFEGRSVQ
jgi:hypothetical protein